MAFEVQDPLRVSEHHLPLQKQVRQRLHTCSIFHTAIYKITIYPMYNELFIMLVVQYGDDTLHSHAYIFTGLLQFEISPRIVG